MSYQEKRETIMSIMGEINKGKKRLDELMGVHDCAVGPDDSCAVCVEKCVHQCSSNCRRVGCNCDCGEYHISNK